VVGKTTPQGHANSLKAELQQKGVGFTLSLQNTGKVHYRTKGLITVKDSNGNKAFEVGLPDVPVLPESEREIKVTYEKPIPKGEYSALAVVDIGKKELIGAEAMFSVVDPSKETEVILDKDKPDKDGPPSAEAEKNQNK
jgi:hypothetical protein